MSTARGALRAAIDGIGVLGPGLTGWPQAHAVLTGALPYQQGATVIPAPAALPPAERRRTGRVVNLALAVGYETTAGQELDLTALPAVFASSGADSNNCHEIFQTLASADRQLSPTRFHNSVHNITGGYWSIATHDIAPYTVVCAYDGSFAAGLLEALAQLHAIQAPVLLLAYDVDYPPPLRAKRPIPDAFGLGLLLRPDAGPRTLATVSVALGAQPADTLSSAPLEQLRSAIPAARALPLLDCIAGRRHAVRHLEYQTSQTLAVEIAPCN